jgi:dynein heavy chain
MSAAFMSYAGPFPSEYRREFIEKSLLGQVKT